MGFLVGSCARKLDNNSVFDYTYSSASTAWTPIFVSGVGYLIPHASLSASVKGAYYRRGVFSFIVANGVTVAVGENLYYDETNAVVTNVKPTTGNLIGKCLVAGTGNSGGTVCTEVDLNQFAEESGNFKGMDIISSGTIFDGCLATAISTADDATLTAAQILGGLILRDPSGAARTDTLPTAALLVAALDHATVNTKFEITIRNTGSAGETITLAAGVGGTLSPTTIEIGEKQTKTFIIHLTNVTASSEAYTCYEKGAQKVEIIATGLFTTVGGDATESITVAGAVATDTVQVTINTSGSTPRTVTSAIATTDAITVTMSDDPSSDHVLNYTVFRAR